MVIEKISLVVFDDSVKEKIIKSLGFSKNQNSELVDSDGKIITSQNFESINNKEFAGVLKGSKIPIKKDDLELRRYFLKKI